MSVEEDMRRLEELAVSGLLEPLSTDEAEEYAALKGGFEEFDVDAIEHVVALAHLAVQPAAEPVPRRLRAAVRHDADEFFGVRHTPQYLAAGWWLALAASAVTVFVLLHHDTGSRSPPTVAVVPSPQPVTMAPMQPKPLMVPQAVEGRPAINDGAPGDLSAERRAFLASHPHSLQRAWRPGGDPSGERVMGDVVWDVASQTGFMRFVNLRRNEPNSEQYQLWIFDAERNQLYPVDGGVFDIASRDGEQIVRIQAKLRIRVPLIFAVTVEHPGGVVVSDRSRIAAIATVT